jgi:hypothetical protein
MPFGRSPRSRTKEAATTSTRETHGGRYEATCVPVVVSPREYDHDPEDPQSCRVRALLVEMTLEENDDVHLVIAQPGAQN